MSTTDMRDIRSDRGSTRQPSQRLFRRFGVGLLAAAAMAAVTFAGSGPASAAPTAAKPAAAKPAAKPTK